MHPAFPLALHLVNIKFFTSHLVIGNVSDNRIITRIGNVYNTFLSFIHIFVQIVHIYTIYLYIFQLYICIMYIITHILHAIIHVFSILQLPNTITNSLCCLHIYSMLCVLVGAKSKLIHDYHGQRLSFYASIFEIYR